MNCFSDFPKYLDLGLGSEIHLNTFDSVNMETDDRLLFGGRQSNINGLIGVINEQMQLQWSFQLQDFEFQNARFGGTNYSKIFVTLNKCAASLVPNQTYIGVIDYQDPNLRSFYTAQNINEDTFRINSMLATVNSSIAFVGIAKYWLPNFVAFAKIDFDTNLIKVIRSNSGGITTKMAYSIQQSHIIIGGRIKGFSSTSYPALFLFDPQSNRIKWMLSHEPTNSWFVGESYLIYEMDVIQGLNGDIVLMVMQVPTQGSFEIVWTNIDYSDTTVPPSSFQVRDISQDLGFLLSNWAYIQFRTRQQISAIIFSELEKSLHIARFQSLRIYFQL
eukprot:403354746